MKKINIINLIAVVIVLIMGWTKSSFFHSQATRSDSYASYGIFSSKDSTTLKSNTEIGKDSALETPMLTSAFNYVMGRIRLYGDAGSRYTETMVTAATLTTGELPPLNQGMVNVTGEGVGYRMQPDGMIFKKDISIVIPYDSTLLPQGYSAEDIVTYYYDKTYAQWIAIERDSVSEGEQLVYSKVNHFTDFINAVLKVPEMPETSAFAPTDINGLKAANPLDGLSLMQPPTANNSGSANLSYPLEIPAGRQGMQPNLTLSYNSGSGNGWLGVGWDIVIPAITVETRWGVPRYDHEKESDVYLLSGEQLVTKDDEGHHQTMPHRTNQWPSRMNGNTRFYPRVDESFDSIVRHGNNPTNYWWSVTDRNGITYYYGKSHTADEVDYSSVLHDINGNIAHWALTEIVDGSANSVRYYYDKLHYTGNDIGKNGVEICLNSINYSGSNGNTGKYNVYFNRQNQGRADVRTNCRYGFKETSASTLCNIQVWFDQKWVRTFYFVTENCRESNYKTRLRHFIRLDGASLESIDCNLTKEEIGILINKLGAISYDFDYYDYPTADEMFSDTVNVQLTNDAISSTFLTPGFTASALGATKGKSWSLGGSASIGLGANVALSTVSAGGNFDYSRSQSEGQLTLIDLNGDGLADKIFKKSGMIYYRPQIRDDATHFHFGTAVQLSGITDFLKETSTTIDWGLQLSALFTISGSWPTTKSTTTTYFADINNDGLPDLVTPAGALFNSLNSNGIPTFTHFNQIATTPAGASGSQSLVITSDHPCDGGIIFDGEVNSDLGCQMQCDTLWTENNTHDSLVVWQQRGYECFWTDYGKKLYGYRCKSICDESSPDPNMEAVKVWIAQKTGFIDIQSIISMYPDSSESRLQSHYVDGIIYSIQVNTGNNFVGTTLQSQHDSIIWQESINPDDATVHSDTVKSLYVHKDDILFFRLKSKQNHSFDKVFWKQKIVYHGSSQTDDYGINNSLYQSDSDFVLCGQNYFKATGNGDVLLDGVLLADDLSNSAKLVIKRNNSSFYNIDIDADSSYVLPIDTSLAVNEGEEIKCEIYVPNNGNTTWGNIRFTPRLRFCSTFGGVTDTLTYFIAPKYHIHNYDGTPLDTFYHKAFGALYRGWGQFAYNNNDGDSTANAKIKVSRLILPSWLLATTSSQIDTSEVYLQIDPDSVGSESNMADQFSNIYNPTSEQTSWVEMSANTEFCAWVGYGNITYINSTLMANTRCLGYSPIDADETVSDLSLNDYDYPVPNSIAGSPVNTIRKQNKSKLSNSSYGVGYIASVGSSESDGRNTILSDYMDMNGDGYPDFLANGNIQYTMPWGGIGEHFYCDNAPYFTESATKSAGLTFGASYSLPKRTLSVNQNRAKISFNGNGSVGASHGSGSDHTCQTFLDINGDGLPDKITRAVYTNIALNQGYTFSAPITCPQSSISEGTSDNYGMNIGANFDIAQASIGGGLSVNFSNNKTTHSLIDMNGDGLPDRVVQSSNGLSVAYNCGNGQWTSAEILPLARDISYGRSFSESVNAAVTVGFTFCGIAKVTVGVQASPFNRSFSRDSVQLVDINGDGYVDCVTSTSENLMTIRYNQAGKTNLLKQVTNFTGSLITMDYELSVSSYEQPQRSWNLEKVVVNDVLTPLAGEKSLTTFEYRNPHYDRFERISFGYDTVIAYQFDTENDNTLYRYTVQGFNNYNFHKKGKKKSESIYAGNGQLYVETLYEQQLMDWDNGTLVGDSACPGNLYLSYEAEITRYYEGHANPLIVTEIVRKYDTKRNVVEYITKGDTTRADEYLKAQISYKKNTGHNLISLPDTIVVLNAQNDTLRLRTAVYDTCGHLTQLKQYAGDSVSQYNFRYDPYGNIDSIVFPRNYHGQRMFYCYRYDTSVNTYPIKTIDAFGYNSCVDYDYRFGKPTRSVDMNGVKIEYQYDSWGRLVQLTGPYEQGNTDSYTIKMSYKPHRIGALVTPLYSLAATEHYDIQHPDNPIVTLVSSDGLGRVLQTKKDAEISGTEQSLVSGKIEYDCFGRTIAQYHPFSEPARDDTYNDSCDVGTCTHTAYDILDRTVKVILPTGDSTVTTYDFDVHNGKRYFKTTTTDPKGISVTTLTNARNQQVKTIAPLGATTVLSYNALGELLSSTDPIGLTTQYTYDQVGRLLSRTHPDAGTDTYTFDAAGNMLSHATQRLKDANDSICYHYTFNRLDSVIYPENHVNNIYYTYGNATSPQGLRGRITHLEDASGFQTFFYGKLGEVTENHRTFVLPNETQPYTFKMTFEYDTWNRVQNIVYPDGEKVSYYYNLGGKLRSMKGEKDLQYFRYIDSIHYNTFELKCEQWFGNGTRTKYNYDTLLRLSELMTYNAANTMFQTIDYQYDAVGNILEIANTSPTTTMGLGGAYTMNYTYDSLYRLQSSTGTFDGTKDFNYWLNMAYTSNGSITRKQQLSVAVSGSLTDTLINYDNSYNYVDAENTLQGNRVQNVANTIGSQNVNLKWDANGNLQTRTIIESPTSSLVRTHCWDEENRLQGSCDKKYAACYFYDAGGERFYKFSGTPQSMVVNGEWTIYHSLTDPVLYASPYLVATAKGYTKHYYAENERVASKVGTGKFAGLHAVCLTTVNVSAKRDSIYQQVKNIMQEMDVEVGNIAFDGLSVLDNMTDTIPETELYFYHSDHLGSAAWVTGATGQQVQHLCYLPFGENFVDQRVSSYDGTRYTFSAKEKDLETGYSYFGARYYSSDLSIWLSVDPMSDKYPSMSAYMYCAGNPVKLVDPNGMEWEIDGCCYVPGQACPDKVSQNTKYKWESMNKIYSTKNGKKVIDEMNVKGVMYKVSSESNPYAQDVSGSYSTNCDGTGGTIFLNGNDWYVGGLAHEIFHGYQDLHGQGKASIFGEVEARLFAQNVSAMSLGMPQFSNPDSSPEFRLSITTLQNNYSDINMNEVISEFKLNVSGYDNVPDRLPNQKCLIKNFYPL